MNGTVVGIPCAALAFLAINYYLRQWDWVGDNLAINAVAGSVAAFIYFLARAMDVVENEKRDNPPSFISPQTMPECFGNIKELLSEASMGPYFWSIKTVDPDQGRLTAFMKFNEIQGGGLAPTLQISRLVLVDITVSSIPEEEQQAVLDAVNPGAKGQSNIQLTWRVDSPTNRIKANEFQEFTEGSIKDAVGLNWHNKPKKKSPFMPPEWLWMALIITVIWANQCNDRYQEQKTKAAVEPQIVH